ncbi:MAG: membrane protein insertase YidC [Ilumatobacter sp.]
MFEIPAALLSWFYGVTNSYIVAIALMSVVVMAITTPLTLKSTKGMLEMQKLSPEMRRLQNEHRNDKQTLNEEMMKLYQENKVNPMSSCLPIFAQMPVFIVMFRILRGWTYTPDDHGDVDPIANATFAASGATGEFVGFIPRYLSRGSDLFQAIYQRTDIPEIGLDLSLSPAQAISDNPLTGIIYALLVVALGGLYFGQQRMVAARAAMSPTMSPTQQKVMQYLPVVFAVFQIFFLTALVIYYIFQTLLRILQQYYITKKFYGGDESLGRQAQRAGEDAREQAKESGESQGLFGQMKRDLAAGRPDADAKPAKDAAPAKGSKPKPKARPTNESKRVTPPKSRPTTGKPPAGGKGRPTPSRKEAQASKSRPAPSGKNKSSGKNKKR